MNNTTKILSTDSVLFLVDSVLLSFILFLVLVSTIVTAIRKYLK